MISIDLLGKSVVVIATDGSRSDMVSPIYQQKLHASPRVLLGKGVVASPSPDGRWLAVVQSKAGCSSQQGQVSRTRFASRVSKGPLGF